MAGLYATLADGSYLVGSPYGNLHIYLDNIPGPSASHDIVKGWGLTRLATINGSFGAITTPAMFQAALDALSQITGPRGSPCPDLVDQATGKAVKTYLEQFLPEAVSAETVKVRIVYKGYQLPTYEFAGSLAQYESNVDAGGNLIQVEYKYPDDYRYNPKFRGQTIPQGAFITRPVPEPIFIVKYNIQGGGIINGVAVDATTFMSFVKISYEGYSNSNTFGVGYLVGVAGQWLVDSIRGVTRDGGFSYEVTWCFHFRQAGWDPLVTFINPDDGKPPPDLIAGVGFKRVSGPPRVAYPTFNFDPN